MQAGDCLAGLTVQCCGCRAIARCQRHVGLTRLFSSGDAGGGVREPFACQRCQSLQAIALQTGIRQHIRELLHGLFAAFQLQQTNAAQLQRRQELPLDVGAVVIRQLRLREEGLRKRHDAQDFLGKGRPCLGARRCLYGFGFGSGQRSGDPGESSLQGICGRQGLTVCLHGGCAEPEHSTTEQNSAGQHAECCGAVHGKPGICCAMSGLQAGCYLCVLALSSRMLEPAQRLSALCFTRWSTTGAGVCRLAGGIIWGWAGIPRATSPTRDSTRCLLEKLRMHDLLAPMTFANGRTAANRVWLAPMTNLQSHPDGSLSDDELRWLEARAEGGFGVIESCATHIDLAGQGWEGEWGIFEDRLIPDWERAAQAMQAHGALLIAQIFHAGMRAVRAPGRPIPWSASASGEGTTAVRAGTEADIEAVIEAFAQAARRVHAAGGDGVELHGAHGYLLCQFLSATMNQRTDQWGGSLENRARLTRRVLQAVRAAVPADFVVGVRLSPEDFGATMGLDLDESVQGAKWIAEDGADFVHISLWDATRNTVKRPAEHANAVFRAALPASVPVITAGNIWTKADATHQLSLGADAVALGRSAIANPAWPKEVAGRGAEPVRPPLTQAQLVARALGPAFVQYMGRWKGFVSDPGA